MTSKQKYTAFERKVFVPIYSQDWWMDAVCGEENWDVWLYGEGNDTLAAMPYYMEVREGWHYITKAPLTQNNGIIFRYPDQIKRAQKAKFEEKIINAACGFIQEKRVDVYEQQYMPQFRNLLPFYWNGYTAIPRYTYVIDTSCGLTALWENMTSNKRKNVRKGQRNGEVCEGLDEELFYSEHKKIFEKQNLPCPFSYALWKALYQAVEIRKCGKILYSKGENNKIQSILFLVWDAENVYLLLGGSMPEYSGLETYSALIWEGIQLAVRENKNFDFEGSVIKRISKSFCEFGGELREYYRIRKVFNKDIMAREALQMMN
jgi:hypothetical protein